MNTLQKILLPLLSLFTISACYAQTPTSTGYIPVDQGKIYYERYGQGSPILVIHGGPGLDQSYLKPQLLALTKNHEVIFYDQRGTGKSLETAMDRSVINLEQFVEDINAVVKELKINHIIVLGHSWGGFLAMNFAIQHPELIDQLILVGSMPADIKGILAVSNEIDKRTAPFKDEVAGLFDADTLKQSTPDEITAMYRKLFTVYFHNPTESQKLNFDINIQSELNRLEVQAMLQQDMFVDLFPKLKKLNVPTLLIHGDADVVPMWAAEAIAKAIPNAKLVVMKECGHFPFVEKSEEFFKVVT